MTAQKVIDYIEGIMDDYVLRPTQKIDTLMQAIEDAEAEDVDDDDDDDDDGDDDEDGG
ncbi:unnamed protein product [marine sediment metagenome]|uniref:Uncharacterized protein n=1 Tax=marine sediment metagenome TaxID=412755 RepID=X1N799_9ZZZZ